MSPEAMTKFARVQAGGDHLNDGVRRLQAEAGLLPTCIKGLRDHAGGDERALCAVCFAVAMILRGADRWRSSVKWKAARSDLLSAIVEGELVRVLTTPSYFSPGLFLFVLT
jgi:hypothetical protein